jgi:hypothetical protein
MSNKNIEMMKKIIEEKKKKSSEQGGIPRANMDITEIRNSFKKNKKGGLFDK